MKKIALITLLAGSMTFSLFAFMAFLISSDKVNITTPPEEIPFDIVQLPDETPPQVKAKPVLQPPEPPPPMPRTVMTPDVGGEIPTLVYTGGDIQLPDSPVNTLSNGHMPDGDARPLVRVNPKYPIKAARDGIEGWVVLAFNINKVGEVINISVVDSQPKRVFDKAARQALKKWKYRAKTVEGIAVEQHNFSVQLDFKMSQES